MKVNVYSMQDNVSLIYNGLYCAPTDSALVRAMLPGFQDPKNTRSIHEFKLFQVGTYTPDENKLESCSPRYVPWECYQAPVEKKAQQITPQEFEQKTMGIKSR